MKARPIALLALAAVALWSGPAHAGVEWEVTAGLGDFDRDGVIDGARAAEEAAEPRYEVRVRLTGATCPTDGEPALRVDGETVGAEARGVCRWALGMLAEGAHRLQVGDEPEQSITVAEHVVVSIGDSVASGEGNPDERADFGRRARWLDRACHRSMRSGHAQAALAVERASSSSTVTFMPLGCSGATIPIGLLRGYAGVEPEGARAAPQVELVNQLAEQRGGLDALLINVGANDVHFGDIVQFCASVKECPRKRFDPRNTGAEARDADAPTLDEAVTDALRRLEESYEKLDEALSDRIQPDRILMVEYFDPTTGRDGYCDVNLYIGRVDEDESEWAQRRVVRRLNELIAETADRYGWRLVAGVDERFSEHGICRGDDKQRWVRTPEQSLFRHGARIAFATIAGTLHPNGRGHIQTARLIRPVLGEVLQTTVPDDGSPDPSDDEDRLLGPVAWAAIAFVVLAIIVLVLAVVYRRTRAPAS